MPDITPDPFPISRVLGALIQAERCSRGLSRAELSLAMGGHHTTISKLERGVTSVRLGPLLRVCEAMTASRPVARPVAATDLIQRAQTARAALLAALDRGDIDPGATSLTSGDLASLILKVMV